MSVPLADIHVIPRNVYIHKDVVDCVGSGGSAFDREDFPDRVYFARNYTTGRVYPVEVVELFLCVYACKHHVCMLIEHKQLC